MGIPETPITPPNVTPIPSLVTADRVSVGYDGRPILAEASFALERGIMDEYILTSALGCDKSIAFLVAKPLHGTFGHFFILLIYLWLNNVF